MPIDLRVYTDNETAFKSPPIDSMISAFEKAIELYGDDDERVSISVRFVTDAVIADLNKVHLNIDTSTDVLSWQMGDYDPEADRIHLGDIAVSLDTADATSQEAKHSLEAEGLLYALHGLLHILGFDDNTEKARSEMMKKQLAILSDVGIEISE